MKKNDEDEPKLRCNKCGGRLQKRGSGWERGKDAWRCTDCGHVILRERDDGL